MNRTRSANPYYRLKAIMIVAVLLLFAASLALALAGRGGTAATSGASPPAPTVAQVAAQIGATVTSHDTQHEMFTYDQADATWHGRRVLISTFRTDRLRDEWVQGARQFTGIAQEGHLYAVSDTIGG